MSKKLGEIFVKNKIATQEQVDECLYLQQQDKKKQPLGYYLITKRYIKDDALWEFVRDK